MVKALNRTVYVGTFRHAVDEKKRVAIPAEWRAAAKGASEFYVLPSKSCLMVLPAASEYMTKLMNRADDISIGENDRLDALRMFAGPARGTRCDKQGRINLPDELLQHAGIDKDAVLVGMFNKFEIWSPERLPTKGKAAMGNYAAAAKTLGI